MAHTSRFIRGNTAQSGDRGCLTAGDAARGEACILPVARHFARLTIRCRGSLEDADPVASRAMPPIADHSEGEQMADTKKQTDAATARSVVAVLAYGSQPLPRRNPYHRPVTGQVTRRATLLSLYE